MTNDCPGYDRDRQMCLIHPGDCEFSPPDGEAALLFEAPDLVTLDPSAAAMSRDRAGGAPR